MSGTGRVGVVIVVPRLTHGQNCQWPKIGRLVPGFVWTLTNHVTDRVSTPRDVVHHRNPYQPGPNERRDGAPQGPGCQAANDRRQSQLSHGDPYELLADADDVFVSQQVGDKPLGVSGILVEQPAHVSVPEPLQDGSGTGTEQPR